VLLAEDYERNLQQIEGGVIPPNPSLYVQAAAGTDPSLAPPGHSTLYMLVPVPNLHGGQDWAAEAPRYRRLALDRLKALGLHDLESRIRYERVVTPQDWQDEYAVGYGATFNLAHNVRQMMHFRPRNRFGKAEGVYLVGGGTHPGSGLPVIYEGARISAKLLMDDLGMRRTAAHDRVVAAQPALGD
jgi:phytoene desaturase